MATIDTTIVQSVKELPDGQGYQLTLTNGEVWFVPNDPGNSHYQLIQAWINEGNTPDPPYTIDELKDIKIKSVTDRRRGLENQGIVIIGSGGVNRYYLDTSLVGRNNLANTIQMYDLGVLDKTNQTVSWKFKDGIYVDLNYDQLVEMAGFAIQYIESLFNAEKTHRESIAALTTLEDVEAYDITANWPSNEFTSTLLP